MVARTARPTDENETPARHGSGGGELWAALARRFPRAKVMLPLAALVLVLNVLHVRAYATVSPFDEIHHLDYLIRGSRAQPFLQLDDRLTQEALRDIACRRHEQGLVPYGVERPSSMPVCGGGPFDARDFVWRGHNAAASHTPTYYLVTGSTARVLKAVAHQPQSLVTWGRLLGSVWLLVGCYLVVRAAELLSIGRVPLLFGLLLASAVPAQLHASTTVNPDATAFAAGAGVLLAALAWERRGRGLWIVAAASSVCTALDPTNVAAVVVVVGFLAARGLAASKGRAEDGARPWRGYLGAAVCVAVAAAAPLLLWEGLRSVFLHSVDLSESPVQKAFEVDGLEIRSVLGRGTIFAMLPPAGSPFVPSVLTTTAYLLFTSASIILLSGTVVAASFRASLSNRMATLAPVTLATLIITPSLFVLYNFLALDAYFDVLPRYGLSVLPAVVLVMTAMTRHGVGRVALATVSIGLYASAVFALL
jgi:hypothetical protein